MRKTSKYALLIGINDYPGMELAGCINDCMDLAAMLESKGFETIVLTDESAYKDNIIAFIEQLIGKAKFGDTLFISFSGHGSFVADLDGDEDDGTDEILCCYDITVGNYITDDELYTLFSKRKHGVKLIFFSDSCHSGTVNRKMPAYQENTADQLPILKRFLPPSYFAEGNLLPREENATVKPVRAFPGILMAGCKDSEYSYDAYFNGRPNGAFTFYALHALQSLPENSSYTRWYNIIRQMLPNNSYMQTPQLSGSKYQKGWRAK